MGTTTPYALPFPDPSTDVNIPRDIKSLAESTDDTFEKFLPIIKVKSAADFTVNNATTWVNDPDFTFNIVPGNYAMDLVCFTSAPLASDIQLRLLMPAGTFRVDTYGWTTSWTADGAYVSSGLRAETASPCSQLYLGGTTSVGPTPEWLWWTIQMQSGSGTVQMQWMQVATGGTSTVYRGSRLTVHRARL